MLEYAPCSENAMSYEEAVIYCRFCKHNGHNDWRLPTLHEYNQSSTCIDNTLYCVWLQGDRYEHEKLGWRVVPVRDI